MALSLNTDIFKAYDVRGTYPDQVNEDAARAIGAAFVTYLKAKRIAVGRDGAPMAFVLAADTVKPEDKYAAQEALDRAAGARAACRCSQRRVKWNVSARNGSTNGAR